MGFNRPYCQVLGGVPCLSALNSDGDLLYQRMRKVVRHDHGHKAQQPQPRARARIGPRLLPSLGYTPRSRASCSVAARRALNARPLQPAQQYAASDRRHSGTGSPHHRQAHPSRLRLTRIRRARAWRWVRPDSMKVSIIRDQPPFGSSEIVTPEGSGPGKSISSNRRVTAGSGP